MKIRRAVLMVACLGAVLCPPKLIYASGSLSGHAGIMTYTFGDMTESEQSELISHLSFRLKDNSGVSLHFNGRLRGPLSDDAPDNDWSLHSGYLGWASPKKRIAMTAGRRLLYTGVIRGLQDGAVIEFKRLHRPTGLNLTVAAGQEAYHGLETGPADNPNPWTLGLAVRARPAQPLAVPVHHRAPAVRVQRDRCRRGHGHELHLLELADHAEREDAVVFGIGRPKILLELAARYADAPSLEFPNLVHPTVIWDEQWIAKGRY